MKPGRLFHVQQSAVKLGGEKTVVAVVGSRTFDDYARLCRVLDWLRGEVGEVCLLSGECPRGADALAKRYAQERGLPYEGYPARWRVNGAYDPAAGLKRNSVMVARSRIVVAFWNGRSRGTRDTLDKARRAGRFIVLEMFDAEESPCASR